MMVVLEVHKMFYIQFEKNGLVKKIKGMCHTLII